MILELLSQYWYIPIWLIITEVLYYIRLKERRMFYSEWLSLKFVCIFASIFITFFISFLIDFYKQYLHLKPLLIALAVVIAIILFFLANRELARSVLKKGRYAPKKQKEKKKKK